MKAKKLRDMLDQCKWIADHGNTLEGYIRRYGSIHDPDHYGDGGEAIFAADKAELTRLQLAYARICPQETA